MKNKNGVSTKCVHSGELIDDRFKGATSPLFPSTAYDFVDVEDDKYPRYFNTPNQIALSKIPKELESYYRKVAGENFLKYLDKFICTDRQNIKKFKKLRILCDRWYNELVKTLQPTSE